MNTKTKPLGNVAKVQGGFAFKSEEFVEKGISIVRISNIVDGKIDLSIDPVHYQKGTNYKEYLLESKDILIAMSGATTGKIGRVEKDQTPCLLNQRVGKFIIKDDFLLSDYLYWVVQTPHYQKVIWNYAAGCAQPNISSKQLESINIPLPPLPTQHKIASILETCEADIQKRKEANRLTDEFLKSTFLEMFGDPLKKSNKMKELSEICYINPRLDSQISDKTEVSFVPMSAVTGKGEIDTSQVRKFKEVKKGLTYFQESDILFAKITPCMENGKGAIAVNLKNGIGYGSTEFHVLRPHDGIKSEWVHFLLSFKHIRKIAAMHFTGTAGQKRVPVTFLKDLRVSVPSVKLQQKFADIVQKVEKLRQKQHESEKELTNLFNSLMQRAFRGEL